MVWLLYNPLRIYASTKFDFSHRFMGLCAGQMEFIFFRFRPGLYRHSVRLSVPIDDHFTQTIQYRLTFLSNDFIPSDFENPRHEVALGLEYSFNNHSDSWNIKIGAAVGLFNSLEGGDGDQGLIMNLGITLESPVHF